MPKYEAANSDLDKHIIFDVTNQFSYQIYAQFIQKTHSTMKCTPNVRQTFGGALFL